MKFGVREICDVVLKARAPMKVGNKVFYANEPVLYFDTLKTSSLEGASTTVYAQGGRGNAARRGHGAAFGDHLHRAGRRP